MEVHEFMLRHVLLCLDSSSAKGEAQSFALHYADHYPGAVISCVYVHALPPLGGASGDDPSSELEREILEGFKKLPHSQNVAVRSVLRGRDSTGQLRELAHTADLILMSDDSRGFLSSVTPEPVREIPRPFIFTGGRQALHGPLLVAHDGSWASDRALRCAADIAVNWGPEKLEIVILGVSSGAADSLRYLDAAEQYLRAYGLSARSIRTSGTVVTSITGVVADVEAGLLCMGAFGHTAFREALLGSTTLEVFGSRSIPVLLAH